MNDLTAKRTLVKSPPELWAELSEVESLAGHLGEFGEIRITRADPQTTVAWEGEHASGTVELEPSGWGTQVTLTAAVALAEAADDPEAGADAQLRREPEPGAQREPDPAPEPMVEAQPEVEPAPVAAPGSSPLVERRGFLSRWRLRRRRPAPQPQRREPAPEPVMAAAISDGALIVVEKGTARPRPTAAVEVPGGPAAQARVEPDPRSPALDVEQALAVLESTLDSLGAAHHRPFSRE